MDLRVGSTLGIPLIIEYLCGSTADRLRRRSLQRLGGAEDIHEKAVGAGDAFG